MNVTPIQKIFQRMSPRFYLKPTNMLDEFITHSV